ncbi:MAG: phytanoyl-CoA dioxygenase family protein [Bacteroidota bacterium]
MHQDEFYIPTRDKSLIGVWIAIDDADMSNGCLWIIPGRPGYIMNRVSSESKEYADVDTIDVSAWENQMMPVEVKKDSVVFLVDIPCIAHAVTRLPIVFIQRLSIIT